MLVRTVALCLTAAVALAGCSADEEPAGQTTRVAAVAAPGSSATPAPREPLGVLLLREWDRSRARAYSRADRAALRRLYLPGSPAGRRDVSVLGAYGRRDLRVTHLSMQLLRVRVVARDRGRWVLDVVDRLRSGTVVGPDVRARLPRDEASEHMVVLRLTSTGWRVGRVFTPARR